jgi:hypothetical protein
MDEMLVRWCFSQPSGTFLVAISQRPAAVDGRSKKLPSVNFIPSGACLTSYFVHCIALRHTTSLYLNFLSSSCFPLDLSP